MCRIVTWFVVEVLFFYTHTHTHSHTPTPPPPLPPHTHTQTECSRSKSLPVCGVNGETFESRCHAENFRIAVDYSGPCTAVPGSGKETPCLIIIHTHARMHTCTHTHTHIRTHAQPLSLNFVLHGLILQTIGTLTPFALFFCSPGWYILCWCDVSPSSTPWLYRGHF